LFTHTMQLLFVSFVSLCVAHTRFAYPVARSENTGIKDPYPCGDDKFFDSKHAVTELQPGPTVFRFYENVAHEGAPLRLAISMNGDDNFDEHVLMSHMPHADSAQFVPFLGGFSYSFVVDVPNVKCDRCAFQLLSIMTDKIQSGKCCSYPADSAYKCFSVYHSCANVKINGTAAALSPGLPKNMTQYWHKKEGTTTAYVNMDGDWQLKGAYRQFNPTACTCDANKCEYNDAAYSGAASTATDKPLDRTGVPDPGSATALRTSAALLLLVVGLSTLGGAITLI